VARVRKDRQPRIDILFDRDHVGSVVVNDGNGRYFEPGAGRVLTLGVAYGTRR
jgi:iron complex outermembrane receptor protein